MNEKNTILTVDDSAVVRQVIKGVIDLLGYTPIEATDGSDALEQLDKHYKKVILILLDWNMPVMDGMKTLQAIKADNRFKDIPITMVTTEIEREKVIEAIRNGASNYLMKPFTNESLAQKILEALQIF